MKIRNLILFVFLILAFYMDDQTVLARAGGRGKSSSSSRSFKTSSPRKVTRTVKRTTTYRPSTLGARIYVNYATYHPVGLVESGYYDLTYRYYYANGVTYRQAQTSPIVGIVIVVIVVGIICIVALNSRGSHDDYHSEEVHEEVIVEETVEHHDGYNQQAYTPGMAPPPVIAQPGMPQMQYQPGMPQMQYQPGMPTAPGM